jgi:transcriptional regulator with XRE-family HTH domain
VEIIDRIIELMNQKKIKDAELERMLQLKPKIVYGWKNGRSKSYMDHIPQLAKIFNVSTDYLYGRTDNPAPAGEVFALSSDTAYDDLPPEAIEEIERFKEFVRSKYKKNDD